MIILLKKLRNTIEMRIETENGKILSLFFALNGLNTIFPLISLSSLRVFLKIPLHGLQI